MCEPAVERTSLVQNRSLIASGMPSSGLAPPRRDASRPTPLAMARERIRRPEHIGIEAARPFHRGEMRVGKLDGGNRFVAEPIRALPPG